jgi:hypothetical protein
LRQPSDKCKKEVVVVVEEEEEEEAPAPSAKVP